MHKDRIKIDIITPSSVEDVENYISKEILSEVNGVHQWKISPVNSTDANWEIIASKGSGLEHVSVASHIQRVAEEKDGVSIEVVDSWENFK